MNSFVWGSFAETEVGSSSIIRERELPSLSRGCASSGDGEGDDRLQGDGRSKTIGAFGSHRVSPVDVSLISPPRRSPPRRPDPSAFCFFPSSRKICRSAPRVLARIQRDMSGVSAPEKILKMERLPGIRVRQRLEDLGENGAFAEMGPLLARSVLLSGWSPRISPRYEGSEGEVDEIEHRLDRDVAARGAVKHREEPHRPAPPRGNLPGSPRR